MDKISKFLKNKSIGYYIAIVDFFLAIIVGIFYFVTYKSAIGNNAAGYAPESIGIYLFAGAIVEAVLLVLPQYGFINIIVTLLFGLALYKEIFLVPDFLAGLATGIEYNQGNATLNIVYLVLLLIIAISAVVATFLGFYKNEEDEKADFNNIKGTVNMAKIGGGAFLTVAAILVSVLVVNSLKYEVVDNVYVFQPITDQIRELAQSKAPENDPKDVVIAKQETYDYTSNADFTALTAGAATREDHYLVYFFEGAYSEGYQGQYNEYYANLYLWDDGLFTGKSNSQTFKGYWYNDSDDDGVADSLKMVSNSEKYAAIECMSMEGFYNYQAYIFMHPGWGDGRSMVVAGYLYYDAIALAIDTKGLSLEYKVGDEFTTSDWTVNRILQNLTYGSVFDMPDGSDAKMKVAWTLPEGMMEDGKLAAKGEYEIKVTWGGLETSVTITVKD